MKKRKSEGGGSKADAGRWLLTYSDMITLLLALFIILYSMSSVNEQKYRLIAQNLHSAFNNTPMSSSLPGGEAGLGKGNGSGTSSLPAVSSKASSDSAAGAGKSSTALDEIYRILTKYVKMNHLEKQVKVLKSSEYVQLHLQDVVMFKADTANVLDTSRPILQEIARAISEVYDRVDHITVSGNTADVVVHQTKSEQISWTLSTERALAVLNNLLGYGVKGEKLSVQGYAHYEPVAENETESGRAKNRRVEITIYKNPTRDVAHGAAKASASASSAASSQASAASKPSTSSKSGQ